MLQWNEMHPYNAVHAVQIPGSYDSARLQRAIQNAFENRGLTHLTVDSRKGLYHYENLPGTVEVRELPSSRDSLAQLQIEIERELNTAFDCSRGFNPFRFFVLPGPESFLVGVAYFHAAADAEAVVLLLKDLVEVYERGAMALPLTSLELYPGPSSKLLSYPQVLGSRFMSLPAQIRQVRHSHRPRYRVPQEMTNGFSLFSLERQALDAIVGASKTWRVTVNDLLLGLLMLGLDPLAKDRRRQTKRRNLSLGCIVNLRRDIRVGSRRSLGLFLGSFTVSHEVPEGIPLEQLARDIGRQTLGIKDKKLYLGTPIELGVARFTIGLFKPERKLTFYQKNYPLWGGITNMNLNSIWGAPDSTPPPNYFRGVSTGPATPLVLSVTTTGEKMNMGLSYRRAVFTSEEIGQLKSRLAEHVASLSNRPECALSH